MKPDPFSSSDETHLHALADDRLPRAQAESLHSRMDSSQRQRAEAWAQQRAQLQTLHADWLRQPVPNVLVQAAERLQDAHDTQQHWARWGGFAAGWVLAFGLGWSLHATDGKQTALATAPPQRFVQQAAVAHAVYQPE